MSATAQLIDERPCEKCERPMKRKRYPAGKLETPGMYAGRRFCSRTCAGGFETGTTPTERFNARVRKSESGCWMWTGHCTPDGYGRFRSEQGRLAHRFAYASTNGPIPDGMVVDHVCRRPGCVNPDHLRLLTPADNTRYQAIRCDNTSGYRGVSFRRDVGLWLAEVHRNGELVYSGLFDDPKQAGAAAQAARIRTWGAHLEVSPTPPIDEEDE